MPTSTTSPTFAQSLRTLPAENIARALQPHFRDWRGRPPDLALLTALVNTSHDIGANPAWLCAIVQHESGFCPQAQNGEKFSELGTHPFNPRKAQGLLQFIPDTAARLGTTPAAIRKMTVDEQAQLIGKYMMGITKGQPADSLHKVAMCVFRPSYALKAPTEPFNFKPEIQEENPGIYTPADYVRKVYGKLPMKTLEAIGRGELPDGPTIASNDPPDNPVGIVDGDRVKRAGGGIALVLAASAVLYIVTR